MYPIKQKKDSIRMMPISTPDNKIYLPNYMVHKRPVFIPAADRSIYSV